jgi:hypothetical protein
VDDIVVDDSAAADAVLNTSVDNAGSAEILIRYVVVVKNEPNDVNLDCPLNAARTVDVEPRKPPIVAATLEIDLSVDGRRSPRGGPQYDASRRSTTVRDRHVPIELPLK